MVHDIITIWVVCYVCSAVAIDKINQPNLSVNKDEQQQQCVPESLMRKSLHDFCKSKPTYDPNILKYMYTKDATFQSMDQPPMKILDNIEMMAEFIKQFNGYFNLTKCKQLHSSYKFIGCEHNLIPSMLKGTVSLTGKSKNHPLKGTYYMVFNYVNDSLTVSKLVFKIPLDGSDFEKIWAKVQKALGAKTKATQHLEKNAASKRNENVTVIETDFQNVNDTKKRKSQCIPKPQLKATVEIWCQKLTEYNPKSIKRYYTKDAIFQYRNHSSWKVQDNIAKITGFMKEYNGYYNITKCKDYIGAQTFLGCKQKTVSSIFIGRVLVPAKDKKPSFNGTCVMEFKSENDEIKISKFLYRVPIDPALYRKMWKNAEKKFLESTTIE